MSSKNEKKAAVRRHIVPLEELKIKKIGEGNKHLVPLPESTNTKGSSDTKINASKDGKKEKTKAQGNQDIIPSVSGITTNNISEGNKPVAPPPESTTTKRSLNIKLNESNNGKKEKKVQGNQDIPSDSGIATKSSVKQPEKTDGNDKGKQVMYMKDDYSKEKQLTKFKESEQKETGNKVKQSKEEPQQNINKKDKKSGK